MPLLTFVEKAVHLSELQTFEFRDLRLIKKWYTIHCYSKQNSRIRHNLSTFARQLHILQLVKNLYLAYLKIFKNLNYNFRHIYNTILLEDQLDAISAIEISKRYFLPRFPQIGSPQNSFDM